MKVHSPKRLPIPEHGVMVFESRHASGFGGELQDKHAKFYLVSEGQAQWQLGADQYQIGSNTLIHVPPQVRHSQKDLPNTPVTLYAIQYRPECLAPILRDGLFHIGVLRLDVTHHAMGRVQHVRSIFQEMLFEQEARLMGWENMLHARLIELAVLTIRLAQRLPSHEPHFERGNQSEERVANYAARLKSQFLQPATIEEAAESVCLSRRQFTEIFRRVTGETFRQCVLRLRVEYALKLLLQTDKSITDIALESGFDELSHFHHVFRKRFGDSPACYRRKNRQTE